jgi:transposase-like protein
MDKSRGFTEDLVIHRKAVPHLRLDALARELLAHVARSRQRPAGEVQRAQVLLLLADGWTVTAAGRQVGLSRRHVYKWLRRWRAQGVAGLVDQPHTGGWPTRRAARVAREELGRASLDSEDPARHAPRRSAHGD